MQVFNFLPQQFHCKTITLTCIQLLVAQTLLLDMPKPNIQFGELQQLAQKIKAKGESEKLCSICENLLCRDAADCLKRVDQEGVI